MATVFLGMFSRTRPKGPIFNISRRAVGLQYVKYESENYLDFIRSKRFSKEDKKHQSWIPHAVIRVFDNSDL